MYLLEADVWKHALGQRTKDRDGGRSMAAFLASLSRDDMRRVSQQQTFSPMHYTTQFNTTRRLTSLHSNVCCTERSRECNIKTIVARTTAAASTTILLRAWLSIHRVHRKTKLLGMYKREFLSQTTVKLLLPAASSTTNYSGPRSSSSPSTWTIIMDKIWSAIMV